jgi:hypothetical protein
MSTNLKAVDEPTRTAFLPVKVIRTDGGTQIRALLDEPTVTHYARLYEEGVNMPPLIVFQEGELFWLADGFHRLAAIQQAGFRDARCEVRKGTKRDAVLFALGANSEHGLPLSKSDRTRAIERILLDPEWSKWSNGAIAKHVGVTRAYIKKLRDKFTDKPTAPFERIGLDGKPRKIRSYQIAPATPTQGVPDFTQPNGDYHVAGDYESNWLFYLVRFTAQQFLEWRLIVNGRTDKGVLSEAVGLVMRGLGSTSSV